MKEKKHIVLGILGTLALFAIAALLLFFFSNRIDTASEGGKKIVIQVIVPEEEIQEFTLSTDATTLRQALDEENLIKGQESTFGFFILEANGRKADDTKQEWWSITKNGEYIEYGVDMINIQDKDQYELTLMVGY